MANTKKGPAHSDEPEKATIKYEVGKDQRTRELTVPVPAGSGERLLNAVEREGCTNIQDVRDQINALPHANEKE